MAEAEPTPPKKTDPRNVIIAALGIVVVALGAVIVADKMPGLIALAKARPAGEPITVLEVVLDRAQRRFVDILFDKPLGEGRIGDILGRDPAEIRPPAGGAWRWQGSNVLRFETTAPLPPATEYEITLVPERILKPGQALQGKATFTVRTDQFRVEGVDAFEDPAGGEGGTVVLSGNARFNYPVSPLVLIRKMHIIDPLLGEGSPVHVIVETDYPNEVVAFRSEPISKKQEERELRLVILSDLTPAAGNVPLAADYVQKIPIGSNYRMTLRDLAAQPGAPDSTVRLTFSSPVDLPVISRYVRVTPEVPYRAAAERNVVVLTGAFRPGESYELAIEQGMPGADETVLREAVKQSFRIPDFPPSADFQSQGMFLSARGARSVAIESVNVDSVDLVVDRVYLNNLFILFQYHGWQTRYEDFYPGSTLRSALGDRIAAEKLRLGGGRNEKKITALDLEPHLKAGGRGLYRVGVSKPGSYEGKQRWLLLTDMGVVAKAGDDGFLVWVSSFTNLAPVAGADVRLISEANQVLASGRTDAEGIWRARGLGAAFEKGRPYLVTVERGDDFSFLLLDHAGIDTSPYDVGGATPAKAGYEAFLYGERDIYRPGETVQGVAVVRDRGLRPPPEMPLLLRHRDPEGNERGTVRVPMERQGIAPFTHAIPPYARTGKHTLELMVADEVIGRYRFQVEEFVPDRIKVEIAAAKKVFAPGEDLAWDVAGAYLFGPPAAGLAVESRARLVPAPFAPKGWEGWGFENPDRFFMTQEIFTLQTVLDDKGKCAFKAPIPPGLRPPAALEAILTARVQEQGGRGVSAMQRLRVDPYPYYIAVRRKGEGYPEPGQAVSIEYAAVSPDGAEARSGALRAEFFRDRWHSVLRQTSSGDWRYESARDPILIDTQPVSGGAARGAVTFTPPEYGAYRVVLTDPATGSSSQVEFYASGWGYSPWAVKDPGRIELDLDRSEYRPGETAIVQVRSPFSGRLLVTVEREGIEFAQVHDLAGNTAKVAIPIRAEFRPNAYVTATVIRSARDLEPGGAGRAFGAVPIDVDRSSHRMAVAIAAPEEIRPHTPLTLKIASAPGASVTVAAVDEGILQLIAQKTPDPFAHFYRKIALGTRSYDIFSLLMPEVRPPGRASTGGGEALEGMAQFVRTEGIRRVEPVAFWSGVIRADGSGKASATFDVPEFQGALRVMAVAHLDGDFGSADRLTRVRDPLVLLPTFPRFLSFSETARIPVTVRNDTGRPGDFEVTLAVEGAASVEGPAARSVSVPGGSERTVSFSVRTADAPGDARLTLTATGNEEKTSATASLPVRADLPERRTEATGSFGQASTTLPLEGAGDFRPGTLRRDLRIGPMPIVQFSGRLRDLLHYPYGCVEQTVSSVFPLLYFGDLVKEMDPELVGRADPAVLVGEGIRRLGTMQILGGGFAMWPYENRVHPWGSIYAAHFLVEARKAGHHVDGFVLDRSLDYLGREAKAQATYSAPDLQRVIYALYVLARAGKADLGTMDFIRERQEKDLAPESRALLGAAYAAAGNARVLAEMIASVEDVVQVRRESGGNFNSATRNRALLLLALLDAAPGDPRVPKLVERLSRDARTEEWWTTQETAFTFLALGQFFRRQGAGSPYSGTVYAGDRAIGTFTSRTVTFRGIEGTAPLRVRMDTGYKEGSAFYSLTARGVPTDAAFKPSQAGLELKRTFLTRAGEPLAVHEAVQGDLIVVRTQVRSLQGGMENVVVQMLLPAGLEVENPRLKSTETLPWITDDAIDPSFLDLRDDRVLLFTDLPDQEWRSSYALLRAVTPGTFRLPPLQAEAMYDPSVRAAGERGAFEVKERP